MTSMTRALVIALCTIAAYFGLAAIAASDAHADTGWPPVVGEDGGTVPAPSTPDPGTPTHEPAPAPEGTRWLYGSVAITMTDWSWNNGGDGEGGSAHLSWSCPPKSVKGDVDWYATHITWWHLVNEETGVFEGGAGAACVYPPEPTDTVVTCSPFVDGAVTNPKGPSSARTIVSKRIYSAWSSDRSNPAKCANSAENINVSGTADDLGAYLASAGSRNLTCSYRTYPGTNRAARIHSCGNPTDRSSSTKMGVWCDSKPKWETGPQSWNHTWDWTGCTGDNKATINCQTDTVSATYRGFDATGAPVETFRDGVGRVLRYGNINPTGVTNIRNMRSRLVIGDGVTTTSDVSPYRAGANPTDPTQPFLIDEQIGWVTGQQNRYTVAFMAAGVEPKPWTAHRDTRFDGDITIKTIRITGFDFDTLKPLVETVTKTVTATDINCATPAAAIAVSRTRNSNG